MARKMPFGTLYFHWLTFVVFLVLVYGSTISVQGQRAMRRSQTVNHIQIQKKPPLVQPGSANWFKIQQMNRNREIDEAMGANAHANSNKNSAATTFHQESPAEVFWKYSAQQNRPVQGSSPWSLTSIFPSWMRAESNSMSNVVRRPISPRFELENSFDEFSSDAGSFASHPSYKWTARSREYKRRYPDCGYDFDHTRFDERCCWEEENYLRSQVKMEERKGWIVNAGSYYWDRTSGQCLMSEMRPLLNFVDPEITEGWTCRARANCRWFGESGNCHCQPILVGKEKFRGYTYALYTLKRQPKPQQKPQKVQQQHKQPANRRIHHFNLNYYN